MNAEQAPKPVIARVDPPRIRGRLEVGTGSERQEHCPLSPGYWRWHAWKREEAATREALAMVWHAPTDSPRGTGQVVRVADGLVVPKRSGNAGGGKEPWFKMRIGRKQGNDY